MDSVSMDGDFDTDLRNLQEYTVETFKEFLFQKEHLPFTMEKYERALEFFTNEDQAMAIPMTVRQEMNGQIAQDNEITNKMNYDEFIQLLKNKNYTYTLKKYKSESKRAEKEEHKISAVLLVPAIVKKIGRLPQQEKSNPGLSEEQKNIRGTLQNILGTGGGGKVSSKSKDEPQEPRKEFVADPEKERIQKEIDDKNDAKVVKFKILLNKFNYNFKNILTIENKQYYFPVDAQCSNYYSCKATLESLKNKNPNNDVFVKTLALLENPDDTSLFPFLRRTSTNNSVSAGQQMSNSCPTLPMPPNTNFVAFGQLEKPEGTDQYTAKVDRLMISDKVQVVDNGAPVFQIDTVTHSIAPNDKDNLQLELDKVLNVGEPSDPGTVAAPATELVGPGPAVTGLDAPAAIPLPDDAATTETNELAETDEKKKERLQPILKQIYDIKESNIKPMQQRIKMGELLNTQNNDDKLWITNYIEDNQTRQTAGKRLKKTAKRRKTSKRRKTKRRLSKHFTHL